MSDAFPKYKSRLTSLGKKLHSPSFEPDPLFDIKTHVASTTLPHPAGRKELDNLVRPFPYIFPYLVPYCIFRWASLLPRNGI